MPSSNLAMMYINDHFLVDFFAAYTSERKYLLSQDTQQASELSTNWLPSESWGPVLGEPFLPSAFHGDQVSKVLCIQAIEQDLGDVFLVD